MSKSTTNHILRCWLKKHWLVIIVTIISLFFTSYYTSYSLDLHTNHITSFDLAIFGNSMWNFIQGYGAVTHLSYYWTSTTQFLGMHFSPVVLILSPLFLLENPFELLLRAQSIILALAIVPIYLLLKHSNTTPLSILLITIFYFIAPNFQSLITFDFHEFSFLPLLFFSALYFYKIHRLVWYWVFIALVILTKENLPLLVIMFGLYISIFERRIILGLATSAAGLISFILILYAFIPSIGGIEYPYTSYFLSSESSAVDAVQFIISQPADFLSIIFDASRTQFYLYQGLYLFSTLISSPGILVLAIPFFAEKMLTNAPYHLALVGYQYGITFHVIGVFGLITLANRARNNSSISNFLARNEVKGFLLAVPVIISIVFMNFFIMPFPKYSFKYRELGGAMPTRAPAIISGVNSLLKQIPEGEPLALSGYHTTAQIIDREKLTLLPYIENPRYILLESSDRSNFPNIYSFIESSSAFKEISINSSGTLFKRTRALSASESQSFVDLCLSNTYYYHPFNTRGCSHPTPTR